MRLGKLIVLSVPPPVVSHEPDLVPEHKEAIIQALRWAWSELAMHDSQLLRTDNEEAITEKLQYLLNERSDGRRQASWLMEFETVTRSENQVTADGRIQKKPDLTFRPLISYPSVRNTTRWGWFIECKVIRSDASIPAYCGENGVGRFISGEYAAWMPSGAMLAYVRNGSTPMEALGKALLKGPEIKQNRSGPTNDRSESEHDRSRLSNPCVDITLFHLWLVVPR